MLEIVLVFASVLNFNLMGDLFHTYVCSECSTDSFFVEVFKFELSLLNVTDFLIFSLMLKSDTGFNWSIWDDSIFNCLKPFYSSWLGNIVIFGRSRGRSSGDQGVASIIEVCRLVS